MVKETCKVKPKKNQNDSGLNGLSSPLCRINNILAAQK
uniref:Uncharacterized protein n=1 Tax=Rhizophora mucronata TaxID=61149 RepID=A0A2P2NYS4_RHIMU